MVSFTINQLKKKGKVKDERISNQLMSFIEERFREIDCKNVSLAYNLIRKNSLPYNQLDCVRALKVTLRLKKGTDRP